jgi:hypothetical protein
MGCGWGSKEEGKENPKSKRKKIEERQGGWGRVGVGGGHAMHHLCSNGRGITKCVSVESQTLVFALASKAEDGITSTTSSRTPRRKTKSVGGTFSWLCSARDRFALNLFFAAWLYPTVLMSCANYLSSSQRR